jgi:ABC-type nitrate/sulfonate/bicarbonate transport system ATPase subunit
MYLKVDDISFSYDGKRSVLKNVSFALPKGETIAVVGASGCGKSTLLRLISGILNTNSNSLSSGKIDINSVSTDEYLKDGKLAFMFQEATLMPNLTVRQNIELPLQIKGVKNHEKVGRLIETVGLTEFSSYFPNQLSGGMKTRVALARSFATEPELLLLDEPFSALDIAWKSKLYIELEKLRELHKTTIVVVTHDVQEALLLSNQVVIIGQLGQIQANYKITTEKSLYNRVHNVSEFLEEVYADYLLPIQKVIMTDGNWNKLTGRADNQVEEKVANGHFKI